MKEDLVFLPLGGVGEIGKNLAVYGYGKNGSRKWLMVDCGITFGNAGKTPGVDVMMPDVRFLESEAKNILGLFITHAHEDHIGAVLELWPRLRCPVYVSPFAAAVLRNKVAAFPVAEMPKLKIFKAGQHISFGDMVVEPVTVAHSIPEAHALFIQTPLGNVLHTGDWKLDANAPFGQGTDQKRLVEIGKEGVLALVSDSTNSLRKGTSPSESEVAASLEELILSAKGRVAVTTFSSHIARISAVARAARKAGRQVVVVGRAMQAMVQAAKETGYLGEEEEFLPPEIFRRLPPDRVVCLVTGSQGEHRAALSRIAKQDHPDIKFSPGDRIIYSSKTVPGNEKEVSEVINHLTELGLEVITEQTHLVHVSGHPRADEMKALYSWITPAIAVPVHGEALHMAEHAKLAKSWGVKTIMIPENGSMIRLAPDSPRVIDDVPAGVLYRDGNLLIEEASRTIPERRKLAFAGVVSVSMALSRKGDLVSDIQVEAAGVPEKVEGGQSLKLILLEEIEDLLAALPKPKLRDESALHDTLLKVVKSQCNELWGKKPWVHLHIHRVD